MSVMVQDCTTCRYMYIDSSRHRFCTRSEPCVGHNKWECMESEVAKTISLTSNEILSNLAGKTTEPRILDSGNRREFASGAVRDIQEGKGRCDLLPLDVVATYLHNDMICNEIHMFQNSGDVNCLYRCLSHFEPHWGQNVECAEDLLLATVSTNYKQSTMLLEVAIHFEEGAKKYGDRNWQKGIDVRCYIDIAVRHYLKFLRGDQDEPHDRAFCWNILCAIWTCKHHPELNEYGRSEN